MRITLLSALLVLLSGPSLLAADWPWWRGPRGDGICEEKEAPVRWSATENVAWRVEPPGAGHSSPVIHGDALFLTAAVGKGDDARRVLLRFDARDGRLVWEREVLRAPLEGKHQKNSHASGTPAADGQRVYVAFFGNGRAHVAAVGFDGEIRWKVSPAEFRSMHGFCLSPVLHEDLVIVNCDQDSPEAAIFALERDTGKVRWKAPRENGVRSYVTPMIAPVNGRPRLFISGSKTVCAYDPDDGRRVWVCDGPTEQCVASPVFGHGLVYITGGFPDREILAIRPDGEGDVTASHVAWRARKGVAYVPSPLLAGERFYVLNDETGVLSAYGARKGDLLWQERLGGKFSSSLTYAAGNIYAGSEEGDLHVVADASSFRRVAKNEMGEGIFASPAFSGGRIYLRTTKALYAIGPRAVAPAVPAAPAPASAQGGGGADEPPADPFRVLEPARLPEDARLGKPRDLNAYHPWTPITDPAAWKERARKVREQVLVSAGLWPLPERAPVQAVIHGAIDRGDYTVEKVFFPSYPGFYVTGSLYRPKGPPPAGGKRPAVLSPHGHWRNGRFFDAGEGEARRQVQQGKEGTLESARYPLQARCAMLARLGCVVFHHDMVGNADSTQIPHAQGFRDAEAELRLQSAFGLQTYNSIRAFDFLAGLPDVDPARIGVTGASGGGTQTFILCAVDDRPAVSFPAVMVSTSMQGGCVCENGPYLRVGTGNIELAALAAPRPLGMTGADDWTKEIETKGLPELKALYAALGVPDLVLARCYPGYEHNYNQTSRELMYDWMNTHLKLGFPGPVQERPFQPVPPAELSVFDATHPRPADAVDAAGLRKTLTDLSARQMQALRPRDTRSLEEFRRVVGAALRVMVGSELPAADQVEGRNVGRGTMEARGKTHTIEKLMLSRKGSGEAVPAVLVTPERKGGDVAVLVHPDGKAATKDLAASLLDRGVVTLAIEPFLTGEFHPAGGKTPAPAVHKDYAGYTFGYNRSLLAERVHDILTAVAFARGREGVKRVHLVGLGRAGAWALLARGLAGPAVDRASVDLQGWDFTGVKETSDEMMLSGAIKYGGVPAFAALSAPGDLRVSGAPPGMDLAEEAYRAAGAEGRLHGIGDAAPPGADALIEWLFRP